MDQNTPREEVLAKPLTPARTALNVLALCFALSVLGRGLGESFTVFLKPISESFGWDRGQIVSIYSLTWLVSGLTAPFVGPMQVAVPLSPLLLLIETWIVSETVHCWPRQFTQAGMEQVPDITGAAKN